MTKAKAIMYLKAMRENCKYAQHYNDPHRLDKCDALQMAIDAIVQVAQYEAEVLAKEAQDDGRE
jgi:hypothetical protein